MQPENIYHNDTEIAEANLRELNQGLERLKQDLLIELSKDIKQLQAQKSHLLAEIEQLESQRRWQVAQQQELIQQLVPNLATQLQTVIRQKLTQSVATNSPSFDSVSQINEYNDHIYRLIASLDSTLRNTFHTLEQDLHSYQSSISQKLGQMYTLEEQGEVVLEALISRLRQELEQKTLISSVNPALLPQQAPQYLSESPPPYSPSPQPQTPVIKPEIPLQPQKLNPAPVAKPPATNKIQVGFILILLSSLTLSLFNVVISLVAKPAKVFGLAEVGGVMSNSFGNSLLILFLRMVVVIPMLAAIATYFYAPTWQDLSSLLKSKDQDIWLKVIGSGFCLFLSQVLIYIAFGSALSPGVVITIFFIFPIVQLFLSWFCFQERPSLWRSCITGVVFLGVVLISLPTGAANANFSLQGVTTAIGAGVAFALYITLTQACAPKIKPIPFSLINFAVIFVFSLVSLMIFPLLPVPQAWGVNVDLNIIPQLAVFVLILGSFTLISYVLNNIGISIIGAARASIFGATGPVLTSLLAWLIIGRTLVGQQILGMLIVSLGVAGLSLEKMYSKKPQLTPVKKG